MDAKILNKILATISYIYTQWLIGFIPGMKGGDTIREVINVIYYINRLKEKNHVVISKELEKVFKRIL